MKGRKRKEKESESEIKEKRNKVRKVRKVIIHQSLRKTNRKTKASVRERLFEENGRYRAKEIYKWVGLIYKGLRESKRARE